MKTKKRAIFVEENKVTDAMLSLNTSGFKVWRDTNVLSFDLNTAVIVSVVWILVIIGISLLN